MTLRPRLRLQLLAGSIPDWVRAHRRARRLVMEALSTPPWMTAKMIRALNEEARRKSEQTGIQHVVDHIVPIDNPRVCGLTVPCNLQVVPRMTNANKGNAWCEWHGELFTEPEQFPLFPTYDSARRFAAHEHG